MESKQRTVRVESIEQTEQLSPDLKIDFMRWGVAVERLLIWKPLQELQYIWKKD